MNNPVFRPALADEFFSINFLYQLCKEDLQTRGIKQWGDWEQGYPGRNFLKKALNQGELHVLKNGDDLQGAVVLNQEQTEVWSSIIWNRSLRNPLIIHALVIHPHSQGKGLGKILLANCEKKALQGGNDSIRLDAYSGNASSLALYGGRGYRKKGSVFFRGKPEGCQEYYCYEKELKSI